MPRRTPISVSTTTATTLPGRWTKRAQCWTGDELDFAAKYWDIGELGDMHHNPAKNVLHVKHSLEEIADEDGTTGGRQLRALVDSARRKLLAARSERPTPFIDRTLYTGWNAMAVTAYLEAARVLRLEEAREFALRTLDRLLSEAWDGESELHHVIAYPDGAGARRSRRPARWTITPLPCMPASMAGWRAGR